MTQESAAASYWPLQSGGQYCSALCCKWILVQRLIPDESQQFTIRPSGTLYLTAIDHNLLYSERTVVHFVQLICSLSCALNTSLPNQFTIFYRKKIVLLCNLGFSNWTQSQCAIQIDNRIICFTFPLARNFIPFEITYFPTASLYRIKINWTAPSSTSSSSTHYTTPF